MAAAPARDHWRWRPPRPPTTGLDHHDRPRLRARRDVPDLRRLRRDRRRRQPRPATRINLGPGAAPLGRRSFGLVPTGAGTASGPTISFLLPRPRSAPALDVRSESGTTGASYIWVTSLDAPPGHAWRGRASPHGPSRDAGSTSTPRRVPPRVAAGRPDHRRASMAVSPRRPPSSWRGTATARAYVVTGFGCDGNAFNLDAVTRQRSRLGLRGPDALHLDHRVRAPAVAPASRSRIAGSVTDGTGRDHRRPADPPVARARDRRLDRRVPADLHGSRRLLACRRRPSPRRREFRWLRPESQYADAGASDPVLVTVAPGLADAADWLGFGMATSPSIEIEVDDRVVRVSNPDRVYFPGVGRHQARPGRVLPRRR